MEKAQSMKRASKAAANWRLILAVVIIVVIVLFVLGIVIGYFIGLGQSENDAVKAALSDADPTVADRIIDEMSSEEIGKNLRYLTSIPHLAGTPADKEQADYIVQTWLEQGIEHAEAVPYNVLLSYPSDEEGKENKVQILEANTPDNIIHESALKEKVLDPTQDHPDVVPPFNAYSAQGEEQGDVVYANYARVEDFFYLERDRNMVLNGTIIIARYGKIFRGDKVSNAMAVGAKGIILYSDPKDVAPAGQPRYPDGIYLPETGVQRGSTFKDAMDPLTPGYPATAFAYRIDDNEAALPKIPVHPISYADAKEILRRMQGVEVLPEWKGALDGVTYRYGPTIRDDDNTIAKVKIIVHSRNERRTTYNTIGLIRGKVEPDRYVILGNHRDAWGFGAIDPTSGTATLLEVTRVFGKLLKDGWRPRRTIVFCTWGAEEYGLIGSNEWVEENMKNLVSRGVAYVNVDSPLMGVHRLSAGATPNLKQIIYAAAKTIPDAYPEGSRKTMYDTWTMRDKSAGTDEPSVSDLGSGSDYASFLHRMGMSAIDMRYHWDDTQYDFSIYPMYHSVYETYHLVETYYDPEFKYLQAMARLWAEIGRRLADLLIIPMDARDYGSRIKTMFEHFKDSESGQKIRNRGLSMDRFEDAVDTFNEATQSFHNEVTDVNKQDPMEIRRINDKLMMLERGFIDPLGLPGRVLTRHVIFAPSSKDMYASAGFPGLVDAMFDIDNSSDPTKQWREVEREIAVITHHLYSAATTLTDEITSLTRTEL
ncbi:N-acetylated-alpha-linked acidic dipeptidase 2-like [Saccoglossus kowalevskii]|uniref:Glutamate carboxypeptidase 2-like n=1 Tax=Saccoglossus kowalevskii TaxID=10224 RepID=A0ABM0GIS1_SACKO|nr:PREDICTED: glutamate carboxypeptidase 2-like [Saccoglossus kowalevskii]